MILYPADVYVFLKTLYNQILFSFYLTVDTAFIELYSSVNIILFFTRFIYSKVLDIGKQS